MLISLTQAAQLIRQGEVVAIPTETVYGLAADASNDAALLKIYHTKERPQDNPLIVHIAAIDDVQHWAKTFPPLAQRLAKQFWPGPLTLVLPALDSVSTILRAGEPTVALRMPAHPMAHTIIKLVGRGLAAPSANKYTQLSPTSAEHVTQSLGNSIAVVDGGQCDVGIESTIVSVADDDWQLLRPGVIGLEALRACCGQQESLHEAKPKAPGQHLLHYAPRTPCRLFNDRSALLNYAVDHPQAAMLILDHPPIVKQRHYRLLPSMPDLAAVHLYAYLHALDAHETPEILIELPPDLPEWAAIRDRLMRAAYLPTKIGH